MINPIDIGWELAEAFVNFLMEAGNPVVVYGGRFQPFHAGHYHAYQDLVKRFGKDNVYVVTSDKTEPGKSPFGFEDKKHIISKMFGIPEDHIIKVANIYRADELIRRLSPGTPVIWAVGEKDADRLKGGKYFRPLNPNNPKLMGYEQGGYYTSVPQLPLTIGGKTISGTEVRKLFQKGSESAKKNLFKRLYGKFDPEIYDLVNRRITSTLPLPEKPPRITKKAPEKKKLSPDMEKLMMSKIKNPETGNDILVKTALNYEPTSLVHKAAKSFLKTRMTEGVEDNGISKFVQYAVQRLQLKNVPNIERVTPAEMEQSRPALGGYSSEGNTIYLVTKGRMLADILRTLAHELIHRKQDEIGLLTNPEKDGSTGSPIENQANAVAGILLRDYGPKDTTIYRQTLTEGGAYGHLLHPFEDMTLTFGDLKEMVRRSLGTGLSKEGPVMEKTDGQNLMFTYKDGKVKFARNHGHLKNAGATALTADKIRQMFAGRGEIEHTFGDSAKDLEAAIKKLPPKEVEHLFGNGRKFMSMEVIHPSTTNVIPYGKPMLILHHSVTYDDNGNPIAHSIEDSEGMAKALKAAQADQQKEFGIRGQQFMVFSDGEDEELKKKTAKYLEELDKMESNYGLSDKSTIKDFKRVAFSRAIDESGMKWTPAEKKLLINRWVEGDKASNRLKMLGDPDKIAWAKTIDDSIDAANARLMMPLQSMVLRLGMDTILRSTDLLTAHDPEAGRKLKASLVKEIQRIKASGRPDKLAELDDFMSRIDDIGLDKLVPSEGLIFTYKGKLYKYTGLFAPVNRVINMLKYDKSEPAGDVRPTPSGKAAVARQKAKAPAEKRPRRPRGAGALLNKKIVNPETGNNIQIRTALHYPEDHPAHKLARRMIHNWA